VPIRKSSAASVEALAADLASESAVIREAAIARLTVIGPRAVETLAAIVGRPGSGATARLAALRAIEALCDGRSIDATLEATLDPDAEVAVGAVAAARVFLKGPRGPAVLDRLAAIALDTTRPEAVRLAAVTAVGDLNPSTLGPLWEALAKDPSASIRRVVAAGRLDPARQTSPADLLDIAAESELPDDPDTLRQALGAAGTDLPLPRLHRIVERIREREAALPAAARVEWQRARGAAHVALAKRSSRLGIYDLREAIERSTAPLPVEFLAALSMAGDASCLEAIAAAHGHAGDEWWRRHLGETFWTIAVREGLTRRHAVIRKIEKRWGGLPARPA
jgi:hypothetical protein